VILSIGHRKPEKRIMKPAGKEPAGFLFMAGSER